MEALSSFEVELIHRFGVPLAASNEVNDDNAHVNAVAHDDADTKSFHINAVAHDDADTKSLKDVFINVTVTPEIMLIVDAKSRETDIVYALKADRSFVVDSELVYKDGQRVRWFRPFRGLTAVVGRGWVDLAGVGLGWVGLAVVGLCWAGFAGVGLCRRAC
jgi:hypothetical protein